MSNNHRDQRYSIPKPVSCDKLKLQLTGNASEPVWMKLQLFKANLMHYKSKGYVCRIRRRTETRLTYFLRVSHDRFSYHQDISVSPFECQQMVKNDDVCLES